MTYSRRDMLQLSSVALAAANVVPSPFIGTARAQPILKVNVALNRGPYDASNAPFLVAERAGYFRGAGIEANLSLSKDADDALHRVASNAFDFAFLDFSVLSRFACEHPDDAPVYVLTIFDASPASVVSWTTANVKKPSDLKGKVLAAVETDGAYQLFETYLRAAGVEPRSVSLEMTTLAARETLMIDRRVDGAIGFDSTIYLKLKAAGFKLHDVDFSYYSAGGLDLYSNGIVVSRRMLKDHPTRVADVVRACARGWRDSLRHPDAMLDVLGSVEPTYDRARESERFGWLKARQILTPGVVAAGGFGAIDDARARRLVTQLCASPRKSGSIDFYSHDFVPPLRDRSL